MPLRSPYRLVGTLGLLVASLGAGSYLAYRTPTTKPGQVSVINYLGEHAPIWPALFGVAALALLLGLAVPRFGVVAYSVTAGVFTAYGVGTAVAAVLSHPTGSWLSASFALALAAHAFVLARVAARRQVWMQR